MVYVNVNSVLYPKLLEKGGDKLISVYCILKNTKGNNCYIKPEKTSQNKYLKYFRLLKYKTGLSELILKKQIGKLQELGLCSFTKSGGFYLKGNNKINKDYKKKAKKNKVVNKKFVKIEVGDYKQTQLNSFYFRFKSNENAQKNRIDKRSVQINIIQKMKLNLFLPTPEREIFKRMKRMNKSESDFKKNYCDKTKISNCGFGLLKNQNEDKKQVGYYWKQKLSDAGLIKTSLNFEFLKFSNYQNYIFYKRISGLNNLRFKDGVIYSQGISFCVGLK